ncbi:MAG: DUF91 domain-containing protein [Dehalococcoidia bacterium]|nr:DUF91 domain-containing protein [Dehalococcoidia bacterium]
MPLFEVEGGSLRRVAASTYVAEDWLERKLQGYLRDEPDAIEPGLLILSEEYTNWADSSRRIDLLGLDARGQLVVIELKRDDSAAMDLQAIRYAAMVANMTFEQAVEAHARYLAQRSHAGDARQIVANHLGVNPEDDVELASARPRIILVASAFHPELTTSVLWLNDAGLEIACLRAVPYRVFGELVLNIEQIIPLPEAADYVLRLREKARENEPSAYPEIAWEEDDFAKLAARLENPTLIAMLNLCASSPGEWVPFDKIIAHGGQSHPQARGATGGFTPFIRKWFGRNNWPVENQWAVNNDGQQYYRLSLEKALWWLEARSARELSTPSETRLAATDSTGAE